MSWKEHLRPSIFELELYRPFEYRPGLVRLDANESGLPLDGEDREAFAAALASLDLRRYPEVSARPLREALARRWAIEPDELIVGNGSDEIIAILVAAFGGGSGGTPGKVLFPTPTFGEYEAIALAHGAAPVKVPLDARFRLDEERLLEAVHRERPPLAFFASPNNPTGNRFDPPVMERIARAMDGVFVADEAYADFSGVSQMSLVRRLPGFCVMKSLSKIGFAALRLGALIGPRDLIAQLDKVRLPYNINAVSIAFACAALAAPERLDRRIRTVATLRFTLETGLREIPGLEVYPSDSNFVLIRTPIDARTVFDRLLAQGVLVRNLSRPGPLHNCLRITAGTPEENAHCLAALRASLA